MIIQNIEVIFRIFLPIYIITYIYILFVYSVSSFKKRYKIDPRVITKQDQMMYIFQIYRDVIIVSILFTIIVYSFLPGLYYFLVPIKYLELPALRLFGIFIMVSSLILIRISQIQLKDSWRIGIDRTATKSALITTGIYSRSRNPIALGMVLSILGLFLVIPNIITFTLLNTTFLIFTIRIRIEEEHLQKTHGKEYDAYRKKTRRWL